MHSSYHVTLKYLIAKKQIRFSFQIAFRAALLEQENAILRTQNLALREEVTTLRQMICNRSKVH